MGTALFESLCKLCKHREGLRCAAFPEGIPVEIREMYVDHRLPYSNDNGITFEPKDDGEETRQRLMKVHLRKGRVPAGVNELDRRISRVSTTLRFEDAHQKARFAQCVRASNQFEELPDWCRRLVLDAEMGLDEETCNSRAAAKAGAGVNIHRERVAGLVWHENVAERQIRMTTLERLQELDDGKFHFLCDALLRRLESRYCRLRTHGLNDQGVSIIGQPDSYVGETANSCTIAFCYTVQKKGWRNKVVEDVKEAVAASQGVQEIVVAIPHNADRDDGPKEKSIDWLKDARAAAGKASFRVVDGRDIVRLLDAEHQDLRHQHLGLPYSRLCGQSILASCQGANEEAIAELIASGRYGPARYTSREADRELFRLWQRALRPETKEGSSGHGPTLLIPLVNDAGVGKTSLLAAFVRSLGSVQTAVLVQARNLSFTSEDSLVAHVIHVLQGVLDSKVRLEEEVAITHHMAAGTPLTVVLDGLDEAKDAASVRKAITYWLKSKLGQASILIVSSRPEFWKVCVDRGWTRWMHRESLDDRTPMTTARRSSVERTDPVDGIHLPDRFSEGELEAAWLRAGRSREHLFVLPSETRDELRHPFTLRVYLDLFSVDSVPAGPITRAELLEIWLNRLLDAEEDREERLTRQLFQKALRDIATLLADSNAGSLCIDDLTVDVPRFDKIHPPGPVVKRLLAANILESVPGHADYIRFAVEAVQDFYRAEAEVATIVKAPAKVAERFVQISFTKAYPRLARLGQLLVNHDARHQFVEHLANADARKAAVVLRADPTRYTPEIRRKVTEELGCQIDHRHRVRVAFAINLLSDLHCEEAGQCLAARLLPPAELHPSLKNVGAKAFIKLGVVKGVEFVYNSPLFSQEPGHQAYYFKDTLALIRGAKADFKTALTDYAYNWIEFDSGTKEHGRPIFVLAYLGDACLVQYLDERLNRYGTLQRYENQALVALGTEAAGEVFYRSAKAVLAQIAHFGYQVGTSEWGSLRSRVPYPSGDREFLVTSQFEPYIGRLINDDDQETFSLGFELAIRNRCSELICHAVVAWTRHYFGGPADWVRAWITPDTWVGLWKALPDVAVRQRLLKVIPTAANGEIEDFLIDCLDKPALRGDAAWHLGHFGCIRATASLRQVLKDETDGVDLRDKAMTALALGLLRDQAAVEILRVFALGHPKTESGMFAVMALGLIGISEAETALTSLLETEVDVGHVGAALLCCGTSSAVGRVLALARSRCDGPTWLCDCMSKAFWPNCRRHLTEHYTHVATTELVAYLAESEEAIENKEVAVLALEEIDSDEVRDLLRRWARQVETTADQAVQDHHTLIMSCGCYTELMRRGDVLALPYVLDQRADEKDYIYVYLTAENLGHFASEAVATELRNRLVSAKNNSQIARLLSLIGRFGDSRDEGLILPFLDHSDDLVANVACESLLRLTDPMLVPENWREL